MKTLIRLTLLSILTMTYAGFATAGAQREHRGYGQALSDLRVAQEILNHLGPNEQRDQMETDAVGHIQEAIDGIKRVASERDMEEHPPVDVNIPRGTRYTKVTVLLESADRNVAAEEDRPESAGVKQHIRREINLAARTVTRLSARYGR